MEIHRLAERYISVASDLIPSRETNRDGELKKIAGNHHGETDRLPRMPSRIVQIPAARYSFTAASFRVEENLSETAVRLRRSNLWPDTVVNARAIRPCPCA